MVATRAELLAGIRWLSYFFCMRPALSNLSNQIVALHRCVYATYIFQRCDETPLQMSVVDVDCLYAWPQHMVDQTVGRVPDYTEKDRGVTKLLQTELVVCALTRVGDRWQLLSWKPPVPGQSLGRATSECYFQSTMTSEVALGIDEISKQYNHKQCYVCADRESSLLKSERCKESADG